ncbi:MAG: hypothetical protein MUE95_09915 [Cyclobacteriaceae bacterium]|nr:hypothetical protein [Cyclobacteriaceae bacterium]
MKNCFLIFAFTLFSTGLFAQEEEATDPVPDTVQIGAFIISIHDINFQEKEYALRFWLWTLYKNVSFDFATQLDIPNAKQIDEPQVMIDVVNGTTWHLMKMNCVMKQNWKVQNYPFDKQHLVVHIENNIYDKNRLVFVADTLGSTYDRELTLDGWRITNFEVTTTDKEYITVFGDPSSDLLHSDYASFDIIMDIERDGWGLFWKIFSGMYIAFLIAMVSFGLQVEELEPRFGLPVGGLFAAVGNKYIIDSLLPESNAFTLVDSLHAITFFTIFAILVASAWCLRLYHQSKEASARQLNRRASVTLLLLYILINVYLVVQSI